jgi:hypothetical protein
VNGLRTSGEIDFTWARARSGGGRRRQLRSGWVSSRSAHRKRLEADGCYPVLRGNILLTGRGFLATQSPPALESAPESFRSPAFPSPWPLVGLSSIFRCPLENVGWGRGAGFPTVESWEDRAAGWSGVLAVCGSAGIADSGSPKPLDFGSSTGGAPVLDASVVEMTIRL